MNRIYFSLLVFSIFVVTCHANEEIEYISVTDNGRSITESNGKIVFDEDGIIKYFKREDHGGMQSKTNCEFFVTKKSNRYYVEEKLFWGEFCIIEFDDNENEVLIKSPETEEIGARCKIGENTLEFVWSDGRVAFMYTFSDDGFKNTNIEYLYRNENLVEFNIVNDDAVYEITKKGRTEYNIDAYGDFGHTNIIMNANVAPKTMMQNAINISIAFQFLYFYCMPFLVGKY